MLTTIVHVIKLACESTEIERKNATMSGQNKDMVPKLVETLAIGFPWGNQITAAEDRIKAVKTLLTDAQLTLEKLANESSKPESDFSAETVAVEDSLIVEKTCVERLEHGLATKAKKRQQSLSQRQETSQTTTRQ